jgi:hypothetical protein
MESIQLAFNKAMYEGYENNTFYTLFYYSPHFVEREKLVVFPTKRATKTGGDKTKTKISSDYNNERKNSRTNIPKKKEPIWNKTQRPTHVNANPETKKLIGTNVKPVMGYCNNHQVWGYCEVYKQTPSACNWKRVCSKCGDPTHGTRTCTKQ